MKQSSERCCPAVPGVTGQCGGPVRQHPQLMCSACRQTDAVPRRSGYCFLCVLRQIAKNIHNHWGQGHWSIVSQGLNCCLLWNRDDCSSLEA